MTIYRIDNEGLVPLERTTLAQQGLDERRVQALLKSQIDVISPDTLIVAEEFDEWEGSQHHIDLLGVGKDGNLVVIEFMRTDVGGYMDLQAIRHAAIVSTLTFDKLVGIYEHYLDDNGIELDASESLCRFLGWSSPDGESFAKEVKIVFVSAEFSKDLMASILWLNDFGLNFKCVRLHPYVNDGQVLLDIQTIIPISEAAGYLTRIREKKQKGRGARKSTRDSSKYDVSIAGEHFPAQNKRWMMFRLISVVLKNGGTPRQVMDAIPRRKNRLFVVLDGELTAEQAREAIMQEDSGGSRPRTTRFFCNNDSEIFCVDGRTYVLTNQWWRGEAIEAARLLREAFPHLNIDFRQSE